MKQKQRWIPVNLIDRAEDLARYIREGQEQGEFFRYPVNVKGSQLLVMALAIGLQKIAEDVGYPQDSGKGEKKPVRREGESESEGKDKDFLEKLMGGFR